MVSLSVVLFCGLLAFGSTSPAARDTRDVCINRPNVPYVVSPKDGFSTGSKVTLTGTVNDDAGYILFQFGNAPMTKYVEMNINFLFGKAGFYDVKNFITQIQTGRIRDLGPFARGKQFVVEISLTEGNIYSMTVNNEAFIDFTSNIKFEDLVSFGFGGHATLTEIILDGKDISKENGAEADIPDDVSVGARITIDIITFEGFQFTALFCNGAPNPFTCTQADSRNIASQVENATGSPFPSEVGAKYSLQFDLKEAAIEMSVDDTFIQTVPYKFPPENINLAWIWGNLGIDCIRYEPSASSETKRDNIPRERRSKRSEMLSPNMLQSLISNRLAGHF